MLKIYHRSSCSSSRKALAWLETRNVPLMSQGLETLTFEELKHVLSLTEQGFMEILKHPNRLKGERKQKLESLFDHSFDAAVAYIAKHPDMLRSPIVFTEQKYMIGYNTDTIRQFIPREYRQSFRGGYS